MNEDESKNERMEDGGWRMEDGQQWMAVVRQSLVE